MDVGFMFIQALPLDTGFKVIKILQAATYGHQEVRT